MFKHYPQNTKGSDYVVGDIHGCFNKLEETLYDLGFNEITDRLFSVGDLIDRGTQSEKSLEWLRKPFFHAVRGNHEQMSIDVVEGWYDRRNHIINGGKWFLELTREDQIRFADAFKKLPIVIEVETPNGLVGIVHAECPVKHWNDLQVALTSHNSEAFAMQCMWSRDRVKSGNTEAVEGIHKVIVGHTPVKQPIILGNVHYIDTGAVFWEELTVVKL